MIKVENLRLKPSYTEEDLKLKIAQALKINKKEILSFEYIKKSIDARKKPAVVYNITVAVELRNENPFKDKKVILDYSGLSYEKKKLADRPVVVGFGPAGMFAGLALSKMGLKPIIIEQGEPVEKRSETVKDFWRNKKLNKYSNVQFGEGGAGTFSDGKLNTNLHSEYCKKVLNEFYSFGAPKEILYLSKPHIGSDKLPEIVRNIRNEIIALGGEILFSHKLIGIDVANQKVQGVEILNILSDKKIGIKTNNLFLAIGHSARDTASLLYDMGFAIKQKPFAMGVRIEQKQEDINISQYGEGYDKNLPSADYKLVEHLESGRSVFTFCMCPGGEVVASASNENEIVTNGMSEFKRDKENANSAVLVNVEPSDFGSDSPLAGVWFQEKYEKLAFEIAGRNYSAPAESVGEFLEKKKIQSNINPTYKPGITITKIKNCLPEVVYNSLKEALPKLNQKLKGFAKDENLLIAIESRSSSPITILRDENFESSIKGCYPIGEGAGYAGGIISSAVDGIKSAEALYKRI